MSDLGEMITHGAMDAVAMRLGVEVESDHLDKGKWLAAVLVALTDLQSGWVEGVVVRQQGAGGIAVGVDVSVRGVDWPPNTLVQLRRAATGPQP